MNRTQHALLERMVANRCEFFELIEAIEAAAQCSIEPITACATIDFTLPDRKKISADEAKALLFLLAGPVNAPRTEYRPEKEKAE